MPLPVILKNMKYSFSILILIFTFSTFGFSQETGGIKGKVRGANQNSLAGATITARQDEKDIKSVKSDGGGNFQMMGLAPGVYNFVFEKDGFASGIKYNVEIERKKVLDLGGRLILAVDPGTLVFIKGSVFTEEGRILPGAEIKVERILADGKTKKVGTGYSNGAGEFAFRFSEAGAKYRVTASAKGVSQSSDVDALNAAVYRVALTLKIHKDETDK